METRQLIFCRLYGGALCKKSYFPTRKVELGLTQIDLVLQVVVVGETQLFSIQAPTKTQTVQNVCHCFGR